MDTLVEHLFRCAQKTSGQNNDRSGAVTGFNVLCGREIDKLRKIWPSMTSDPVSIDSCQTDHFGSGVKRLDAP